MDTHTRQEQERHPLAYTVNEFAELFGISPAQVYVLMKRGEIRTFTIGRSRRISHDAAIEFRDRLEHTAA